MKYILSVGTNIGDRKSNIERAIESLNSVPNTRVERSSSVYKTEPVGYEEQNDFYNAVLLVDSSLEPNEMLGVCLGIEAGFGRVREIKNGPRILDLDLIFAEDKSINTENLIVPHPRYNERRFVLEPLLELFPSGEVFATDFAQYIDRIDGQGVEKINSEQ